MLSYNLLDCWAIRSSWDVNAAPWFPSAARCAQHFSWPRVGILVSQRKWHSDFTCMLISSLSDVYDWSGPSWPKEAHSIILLLCCPGSRSPAKICSVHWMRQASCGKMILQPSMIKECHSAQWTTAVFSLQFPVIEWTIIVIFLMLGMCYFWNVWEKKEVFQPLVVTSFFRNVGACRLSTEGPAEKATIEWWSNNAIIWISTRGSGIFFQSILDIYVFVDSSRVDRS